MIKEINDKIDDNHTNNIHQIHNISKVMKSNWYRNKILRMQNETKFGRQIRVTIRVVEGFFVRMASYRRSNWFLAHFLKINEKWPSAYVSHVRKFKFDPENHLHACLGLDYSILDARWFDYLIHVNSLLESQKLVSHTPLLDTLVTHSSIEIEAHSIHSITWQLARWLPSNILDHTNILAPPY